MKTSKATFLKPLQAVVGVVDRKNILPILSNVLIETKSGRTALIATDLELQITAWLDGVVSKNPDLTVSARKLLDICRALPDDSALELSLQGEQLQARAGKSRFSLQTLPAQDFPRLQIAESEGVSFSLASDKLRQLLGRVQYAMAEQDIRYYLNGLLFSVKPDRVLVAATDGHRLGIDSVLTDAVQPQELDVILPRKAIIELIKLLGDDTGTVDIQVSPSQVIFRTAVFELRSKVVDGKFPDYQRVIPVGYEKHFIINRVRFLQSLNRAAILTNDKFRSVRLALSDNSLRIACRNNEQEEAQEELDIDYSNEPLDVGFNVQYLQDVLNNLAVESVRCSFNDASSSLLVTIPGEENFAYVVMPMRI
jgi:DNA polymerase-3 subunit beta